MKAIDLIRWAMQMTEQGTAQIVQDMRDAPLTQPTPGAKGGGGNHPLWSLGHLCVIEVNIPHILLGDVDGSDLFRHPKLDNHPPSDLGRSPEIVAGTCRCVAEHEVLRSPAAEQHRDHVSKLGLRHKVALLVRQLLRVAERTETARETRHGAGPGPDGVVHELLAERHLQLERRRTNSRGHVDEAVEVPCLASIPVDRVAAAQQPGHHRLGDTGREARRNRRVGSRTALFEDLDSGRHRGRVTRCDTAWEHGLLP